MHIFVLFYIFYMFFCIFSSLFYFITIYSQKKTGLIFNQPYSQRLSLQIIMSATASKAALLSLLVPAANCGGWRTVVYKVMNQFLAPPFSPDNALV